MKLYKPKGALRVAQPLAYPTRRVPPSARNLKFKRNLIYCNLTIYNYSKEIYYISLLPYISVDFVDIDIVYPAIGL